MTKYIIGLGSSAPCAASYLQRAVFLLDKDKHITLKNTSQLMVTPPEGGKTQFSFINMAVAVETSLLPDAFMLKLINIEYKLGRVRYDSNISRTIDLDILYSPDILSYRSSLVELPHPRFFTRSFAFFPALECARLAKWATESLLYSINTQKLFTPPAPCKKGEHPANTR